MHETFRKGPQAVDGCNSKVKLVILIQGSENVTNRDRADEEHRSHRGPSKGQKEAKLEKLRGPGSRIRH